MIRTVSGFLLLCALVCLGEMTAQSGTPQQPKLPKVDPNAGPPAGIEAFLGTWKLVQKGLKFEETITIAFDKGKWEVKGIYKMDGKEVGKYHGENLAFVKGTLHFSQVVDEKPPFDLLPKTRGIMSAKDDKAKIDYTSTGEKSSHSWNSPYERIEKPMVAIADPKVDPKVDPKPDPKTEPKTDPKTDPKPDPKTEPDKPAGPYSVVAVVKGVHNGCLSPDGQTVYALSLELNAKSLVAFDVQKKEVVKRIKLEFPDRIRVSDNGKFLAVADYIGFGQKDYSTKVYVYDTATWETVAEFDHPKAGSHLAISADGSRVAVGCEGAGAEDKGTINVWDVAKKKTVFNTTTTAYLSMDLSANGKTLVMNAQGPEKGNIGFIDVDTGKSKAMIKGLAERLVISADGKLAVGALGNKLTVYDMVKKTAKELPAPGPGGISALSLVDNNKKVVAGGSFSETLVVPLDGGKAEKPFKLEPEKGPKLPKGGGIFQCAFLRATPDSAFLLTVGGDRVARVWTLPFAEKK